MNVTTQVHHYRGYTIRFDPPPIPTRQCDWQFVHDDYDPTPWDVGDPPSDHRAGFGPSVEDCMAQIDELESEDLSGPDDTSPLDGWNRQDDIREKAWADDDGYGPDDHD